MRYFVACPQLRLFSCFFCKVCECLLSCFSRVWLFEALWTIAPLSMGFFRREYWSGLPCPPPRDLPDPGSEATSPASPALQTDSSLMSHQESPFLMMRLELYILARKIREVQCHFHHANIDGAVNMTCHCWCWPWSPGWGLLGFSTVKLHVFLPFHSVLFGRKLLHTAHS